jgi:hypothetical protein
VAEGEGQSLGKHSAAELLGNWRGAERDVAAARTKSDTASLASKAAQQAQAAAQETSDAAQLSQVAAQRAADAANRTAEAAAATAVAAASDEANASAAFDASMLAETDAGDRFRDAQRLGFPHPPIDGVDPAGA